MGPWKRTILGLSHFPYLLYLTLIYKNLIPASSWALMVKLWFLAENWLQQGACADPELWVPGMLTMESGRLGSSLLVHDLARTGSMVSMVGSVFA